MARLKLLQPLRLNLPPKKPGGTPCGFAQGVSGGGGWLGQRLGDAPAKLRPSPALHGPPGLPKASAPATRRSRRDTKGSSMLLHHLAMEAEHVRLGGWPQVSLRSRHPVSCLIRREILRLPTRWCLGLSPKTSTPSPTAILTPPLRCKGPSTAAARSGFRRAITALGTRSILGLTPG